LWPHIFIATPSLTPAGPDSGCRASEVVKQPARHLGGLARVLPGVIERFNRFPGAREVTYEELLQEAQTRGIKVQ
jgi:hypothetical protein